MLNGGVLLPVLVAGLTRTRLLVPGLLSSSGQLIPVLGCLWFYLSHGQLRARRDRRDSQAEAEIEAPPGRHAISRSPMSGEHAGNRARRVDFCQARARGP